MKNLIVGVDVSKLKLDFCSLKEGKYYQEHEVVNHKDAIKEHLHEVLTDETRNEVLICAEYTGPYTYLLSCACEDLGVDLWLENPVQIKYRSGLQRGKNDKLDARKIAAYAHRFQDQAQLYKLPAKSIETLKHLVSERDMLVCDQAKYKGQLTDQKEFINTTVYTQKSKRLRRLIKSLEGAIDEIEKEMQELIDKDQTLSRQQQLLCSIDGIGERTAIKMIIETNAFQSFKDPRKFCCHAGVAPFSYTSGSSIRSKRKVSKRADKSIKALLHMAALAASKSKGDLGQYFIRKVIEGKNKMTVINAIRAKLVLRMFAVIKNDRMYIQNYVNPLA